METRAVRADKQWDTAQSGASRLFVVDAGLDSTVFRKQYPNNTRYIMARGQIRAAVSVPLAFRDVFETLLEKDLCKNKKSPRFFVTLACGKRKEPWVVSAEQKKY